MFHFKCIPDAMVREQPLSAKIFSASMYGGASGSVAAVSFSWGETAAFIGVVVAVMGFLCRFYFDVRSDRRALAQSRLDEEKSRQEIEKVHLELQLFKAQLKERERPAPSSYPRKKKRKGLS